MHTTPQKPSKTKEPVWKKDGGDWEIEKGTRFAMIQWMVDPLSWNISFWRKIKGDWKIQNIPGRTQYTYTDRGLDAAKKRGIAWIQKNSASKPTEA
jgi:hypothetical protein